LQTMPDQVRSGWDNNQKTSKPRVSTHW
jgi:hypothetical protein